MARLPRVQAGLALLAVLGSFLAGPAGCPVWAAEGAAGPPPATDVALGRGGLLLGRVVDSQGTPAPNVPVSLQTFQNQQVAAVTSDTAGHFAIQGVHGGVYQLITSQGPRIYRLWAPGTAPPSAQQGATLVMGGETVRGAPPGGGLKYWLTNPWVIGAAVATAIAVPIAVANSHRTPASP